MRIPDLTEERRKDLIKVLKNIGEKNKVSIRNIRREGNDELKKLIKEKNWALLEKVGGTSGDLMVRGECSKCGINLVGENPKPRNFTLPCLIQGCTYNTETNNMKGIQ